MKRMNRMLLGMAALTLAGIGTVADTHKADIVETAAANGSFGTLAKALQAADLVNTLKGPGPFTVFAPTDQAFAKLPPGVVEVLLKPENKEQLRSILTYHVVPGRVTSSDVKKITSAKTVNGQELRISFVKGVVGINEAKVTKADLLTSNGIIHVVDRVILPKSDQLPQVAKIDDKLAEFESKAVDTRRDALFLESKRRNPQLSWETHSNKLGIMKDQINEMGQMLSALEAMKSDATLLQQRAIEAARPHLEDLARRVEAAIKWLNEDRRATTKAEYRDNLHGIWTSADRLYDDVDTILDYKEAQHRLKGLSAPPTGR